MDRIELSLFGTPRLVAGTTIIESFPTRRSLHLLARLAIDPRRKVQRRELAAMLWPDEPYEATGPRLRQELVRLRKALGDLARLITSDGDWVKVDSLELSTDVARFESLIRESVKTDGPDALSYLWDAYQLSKDPFLEGALDDWIDNERRRLLAKRYDLLVRLAEILGEIGRTEEGWQFTQEAILLAPNREPGYVVSMRLLQQMGRVDDALRQFQQLQRMFVESGQGQISIAAQVAKDELTKANVVPRAAGSLRSNFGVGREEEISRLCNWLDHDAGPARLASVLGPGGVGKTHVLTQVGRRLSPSYLDQTALVDLSNVFDVSLVPVEILKALGQDFQSIGDPTRRLNSILEGRVFLLGLDNLEQFGNSINDLIAHLLDSNADLRIVCTSRLALNIAGEYRLALTPLQIPEESADRAEASETEAVRLFLHYVGASGLVISDESIDWKLIVRIVRCLEGLPLALILAAPRLRTLGAKGLLEHLETDPIAVETSIVNVPDRHRSLRNVLRGTFELLPEELKIAMARLSVFRGGWTIEAASKVCGLAEAVSAMDLLLDASLINRMYDVEVPRFRMLETVRAYSATLLSESDLFEVRKRHLDWLVNYSMPLAGHLVSEAKLTKFADFELEDENIREAIQFGIEHFPEETFRLTANLSSFWLYRSNGYEALLAYKRLFEKHSGRAPSQAMLDSAMGHCLLAHFFQDQNRRQIPHEAIYSRALSIAEALGRDDLALGVWAFQAFHKSSEVNYEACESLIKQIDSRTTILGEGDYHGLVTMLKGKLAVFEGDFEASAYWYRISLKWHQTQGDVFHVLRIKMSMARVFIELGDLDRAEASLSGLIDDILRIRFDQLLSATHFLQGRLDEERGRFEDAMARMEGARKMWARLGNEFQIAEQDAAIAKIMFKQRRYREALVRYVAAAELWIRSGYPTATALAIYCAGAAFFKLGATENAKRLVHAANAQFESMPPRFIPNQRTFLKQLAEEMAPLFVGDASQTTTMSLEEAVPLARLVLNKL